MRYIRLALAIVVVALFVTPLLPSAKAPPLAPYEAWGIARNEAGAALPLGTPIRTFIDGVDYSNLTVTYRADGSYQTRIFGNWYITPNSETPEIKEGGDPNDRVMFADGDLTTAGKIFRQDPIWVNGSFQNLDLQEAVSAKQPALLKICRVTTQPFDGLSDYAYLYNPTAAAVDLSAYFFEKDLRGSYTSPTVALSGTVPAGAEIFADLFSTTYLTTTGDVLKLMFRNPGGADSPFGARDVVVDRVEFNATTGGTLYWEPGNTITTDAPAPGNVRLVNGEIHRTPNCGTDTNQGTDFIVGPETGRPTAPTVVVSTPNGGERWTGNSQHYIYWNMSDLQTTNNTLLRVRLNYSLDSGTNWITIVASQAGTANPNRYLWRVPTVNTDTARVQVCVTDPTALTGCDMSDADFSIDSLPPFVASTSPAAGATGVLPNAPINVVFSESMNTASVQTAFSLTPGITPVFAWSAATYPNDNLTITHPATPFQLSTGYNAVIGTSAKDASDPGNFLIPAKSWNFQTLTNNLPTISVTTPVAGVRWSAGPTYPHAVSWTMSDTETVQANLLVYLNYTSGAGNGQVCGPLTGATTCSWTPPAIDDSNVRIQALVIDEQGGRGTMETSPFTLDSTAPTVTSNTPANGLTGVAVDATLTIVFSEAMDQSTFQTTFTIAPNPGGLNFNWVGNTLTVTHTAFLAGTHYVVTISGAKDVSIPGIPMAADHTFAFDTVTNAAPVVTFTVPASAATWNAGDSRTITWTMTDETPAAQLKVWLNYTSAAGSGNLVSGGLGTTQFVWSVPSTLAGQTVTFQLEVFDPQGLKGSATSATITVPSGGGVDALTIGIIAVVLIAVVAGLVFFLLAKRRKKEKEEAPSEAEPEPEEAPPPPPKRAPAAPKGAAPPTGAAGTKECPSCGTILDTKDGECFMCGHKF